MHRSRRIDKNNVWYTISVPRVISAVDIKRLKKDSSRANDDRVPTATLQAETSKN